MLIAVASRQRESRRLLSFKSCHRAPPFVIVIHVLSYRETHDQ
jgi:hypothetical protein